MNNSKSHKVPFCKVNGSGLQILLQQSLISTNSPMLLYSERYISCLLQASCIQMQQCFLKTFICLFWVDVLWTNSTCIINVTVAVHIVSYKGCDCIWLWVIISDCRTEILERQKKGRVGPEVLNQMAFLRKGQYWHYILWPSYIILILQCVCVSGFLSTLWVRNVGQQSSLSQLQTEVLLIAAS